MNQLTTQIALKASTFLVLLIYITGCASGVSNPSGVPVTEMQSDERGFVTGTGIESQDLVSVTDKMARSLVNTPEINDFSGMPRIVLDPVINNTRFPIQQGIFLTRIRTLLNSRTRGKMRFLARERMDALRAERETARSKRSSQPNTHYHAMHTRGIHHDTWFTHGSSLGARRGRAPPLSTQHARMLN